MTRTRPPDSSRITIDDVRGLGRLLVSFAGLPYVSARSGQWLLLLLFLASIVAAAVVVSRDRDEDESDPTDPGAGGAVLALPTASGGTGADVRRSRDAGSTRAAVPRPAAHVTACLGRPVLKVMYVGVLALALVVPTTGASFAREHQELRQLLGRREPDLLLDGDRHDAVAVLELDQTTGTTAADTSGNGRTGTYNTSAAAFTRGITGALTSDTPNLGVTLNGTTACVNTTSTTTMNAPTQITEVVWFKTTTTNGGKLLGFEMPQTGVAVRRLGRHL